MKDSVIISTGHGPLHLYYAARAAQGAGLLHSMLTSFYLRQRWMPLVKGVAKLSRKAIWRKLLLRHDDKIDEQHVVTLTSTEVVSKLCKFLRNKRAFQNSSYCLERVESLYYGKMANRHIKPPVKLIHSRSGFSRAIIPHAHKIGAKVLLEQSAAHPKFTREILELEYEKWEVPEAYRIYVRPMREMEWDIEHSEYILTNSDYIAKSVRQNVLEPMKRKIYVVHTGVNINAFKPSQRNTKKRFKIMYAGSLSTLKGVVYLIKAFEKLGLHNAELLLVGSKHIDRPSAVDKLRSCYTHIQFVPYPEMPRIFAGSDIFVFPSLVEGPSRVVGEALASGLPCIVTPTIQSPNVRHIVKDGINGFIIPSSDIDSLAEKILYLYKNRDLVVEMGRAARESAANSLTWEDYGRNLLRVYEEIIQT